MTSRNRIGGTSPGERNIISANGADGVNLLCQVSENLVIGNYLGTDINGKVALPNFYNGVAVQLGSYGNVIQDNLISGNSWRGITVTDYGSIFNTIIGNRIGIDSSGAEALPNGMGILVGNGAMYTRIGGMTPAERNVISGNLANGLDISSPHQGFGSVVLGNWFGTDVTGQQAIGNGGCGVGVYSVYRNIIGGMGAGEGNVFAGNSCGITMGGEGAEHTVIIGNYVGTDATGTLHLGNTCCGIFISSYAKHNQIGPGNVVAYHNGNGIVVEGEGTDGITIRRNSIHSNTYYGIENIRGGNNELTPPILVTVTTASISGNTCPGCTVEVFSDAEDEGRVYEGTTIADSTGHWLLIADHSLSGPHVTATATDEDGNTSEFSTPWIVWGRVYLPVIRK